MKKTVTKALTLPAHPHPCESDICHLRSHGGAATQTHAFQKELVVRGRRATWALAMGKLSKSRQEGP